MAVSDTKVKEAIILDIQRMSTEDGPGLRTTVFFKGCNLACPWCHNPESIDRKSDLNWFSQKCMGCNICRDACPQKGISRNDNGINFNRPLCVACGSCADACPQAAIELKGNAIGVEKLAAELVKDRAYFGADGGITLSGGEVLIQHEAALELSRLIKAEGVNVAVDTAGCYDFRLLEAMLPYIDIVLYDLKIFDNEAHKQIVKGDNRLITENYRQLIDSNTRVWVRTPIIKGATDSEENIAAIGSFIANAGLPERWELCAFNNLCLDKYRRLDREWDHSGDGLTEKAHIEKLTEIAQRYVPCAMYTGAVKE
ncbi:MAG: glycyl-radical enzyme activating protein [Treponema sp.]|nr:glycyl-radical enzyme activating protein [Treponema sp.]